MQKINLIIWTASSSGIGGTDTWTSDLKKRLRCSDYNLITMGESKIFAGEERVDRIISSWHEAEKAIAGLAPAIVIPNWAYRIFGICAKLNGQGASLKCLGMCHADSAREYYEPLAWYESVISRFIAVSPVCGEKLSGYIPHRKDDICCIPCGIEIPPAHNKAYSTSPLKLVYFGRIDQNQKKVFDLVRLAELLSLSDVDYTLDIIGSGFDAKTLSSMIKKSGAKDRISFFPRLAHSGLLERIKDYDVFVTASRYGGQSVSLGEAMANKLIPCVTRDTGGSWAVIDNGRNGFCVDIGDMHGMAEKIKVLSNMKKEDLKIMGENARDSVIKHFNIENTFPEFFSALGICAKEGKRQWAHDGNFVMPGYRHSPVLPQNALFGKVLKSFFKIVPKQTLRGILNKCRRSNDG